MRDYVFPGFVSVDVCVDESGKGDALYVNGKLRLKDSTVYPCDIHAEVGVRPIWYFGFHEGDFDEYPEDFADILDAIEGRDASEPASLPRDSSHGH